MHAMGGAFIVQLILTFLFMPESAFHREGVLNIDTSGSIVAVDHDHKTSVEQREKYEHQSSTTSSAFASEPKMSWKRQMMPYSGYYDHVSYWRTVLRPFFMLGSPVVIWATLAFTTCISWLVLISITLSQIFAAPPYNFSVSAVGATNVSSFVASVIGTLIAGPAIDGIVKVMARVNHGIFGKE